MPASRRWGGRRFAPLDQCLAALRGTDPPTRPQRQGQRLPMLATQHRPVNRAGTARDLAELRPRQDRRARSWDPTSLVFRRTRTTPLRPPAARGRPVVMSTVPGPGPLPEPMPTASQDTGVWNLGAGLRMAYGCRCPRCLTTLTCRSRGARYPPGPASAAWRRRQVFHSPREHIALQPPSPVPGASIRPEGAETAGRASCMHNIALWYSIVDTTARISLFSCRLRGRCAARSCPYVVTISGTGCKMLCRAGAWAADRSIFLQAHYRCPTIMTNVS